METKLNKFAKYYKAHHLHCQGLNYSRVGKGNYGSMEKMGGV